MEKIVQCYCTALCREHDNTDTLKYKYSLTCAALDEQKGAISPHS